MNGNDRLREMIAEMENFADVADECEVTNAPPAIRTWASQLAALLAQEGAAVPEGEGIRATGIPDGWKLVPIEPTWDMRNEGREFLIDGIEKEPEKLAYFLWKTMIAATPEQPR